MNSTAVIAKAISKAFVNEKNSKQSEFVIVLSGSENVSCFHIFSVIVFLIVFQIFSDLSDISVIASNIFIYFGFTLVVFFLMKKYIA